MAVSSFLSEAVHKFTLWYTSSFKVRLFSFSVFNMDSDSPLADLFVASIFLFRISNADNTSWKSERKKSLVDIKGDRNKCRIPCVMSVLNWLSFSIISSSVILPPFDFCRSAALGPSVSGAGTGSITDLVYTFKINKTGKSSFRLV